MYDFQKIFQRQLFCSAKIWQSYQWGFLYYKEEVAHITIFKEYLIVRVTIFKKYLIVTIDFPEGGLIRYCVDIMKG